MNFDATIGSLDWYACEKCKYARPEGGCDPLDEWGVDLLESDLADNIYCREFEPGEYEDYIQEIRVVQYVYGNPIEIPKEKWGETPKELQRMFTVVDKVYTKSEEWVAIYGMGFPIEWEIQQRRKKRD